VSVTNGASAGAAASKVTHCTTTASGPAICTLTCSGTPCAEVQNSISPDSADTQ
jgi:hypothetical protein